MVRTVRDVFREVVIFEYKSGGSATIKGVFDEAHDAGAINDQGQTISTVAPVATIRDADLSRAPIKGDCCRIKGRHYRIDDAQPDGSGMTKCLLTRLSA